MSLTAALKALGITRSKYYSWKKRYGKANQHNAKVSKCDWLTEEEKQSISKFAREHKGEGYKRLTYMMIDNDIAYASETSVYRVLKQYGLLNKFIKTMPSQKGKGFNQPSHPHSQWHIDISYINVCGTFMFLVAVIDGYSRFIVSWDLRASMQDDDVMIVIQRAQEQYPGEHPRIISDRGGQFIAKDFKQFINSINYEHTLISVSYPQSNGKIERFFRSIKGECVRKTSLLSPQDARKQLSAYIYHYNYKRLHSSIGHIAPYDKLMGNEEEIFKIRKDKLAKARENRKNMFKSSNLFQTLEMSISR
jgi:transposase InsO family protein